jgi:hypothetical protein
MILEPQPSANQAQRDKNHRMIAEELLGACQGASDVVAFIVREHEDGPTVEVRGAASNRAMTMIAATALRTMQMLATDDRLNSPEDSLSNRRAAEFFGEIARLLEDAMGYDRPQEAGHA